MLLIESNLYYSVFSEDYLEQCLEQGIKSDYLGCIYLSDKPNKNSIATFRVEIPDYSKLYPHTDSKDNDINNYSNSNIYLYEGDIPASNLQLVLGSGINCTIEYKGGYT